MNVKLYLSTALSAVCLLSAVPVHGQALSSANAIAEAGEPMPFAAFDAVEAQADTPGLSPAAQELLKFKASDAKFEISQLMDVLRDRRHEGWVLAAYPDPKTAQPLIGAGFSLDLPERPHPQRDPFNPHPFLEPSSADLWEAAGLEPARLQRMLAEFNDHLATWGKRDFRSQIRNLSPQITEDEANALLRVGAIQAVYNAKGYCRYFDRLTASQQMALSQLVYQMGVNLEEFRTFLNLINREGDAAQLSNDTAYWRTVQKTLVQSQWARLYRVRATAVIAMLNPRYQLNPSGAEHGVGTMLRPAVMRGRRGHGGPSLRSASYHRRAGAASRRGKARMRRD